MKFTIGKKLNSKKASKCLHTL